MKYLEDLNPMQREAVTAIQGPVLIIAGAGAGKTKTLTYRILHLINSGVLPESILGVTFTNKAAKEMRERVHDLLRKHVPGTPYIDRVPTITTFHSFGVLLLKQFYTQAGLPKQFSIFDRSDSKRVLKDIYEDFGYDPKVLDIDKVMETFGRAKSNNITINTEAKEDQLIVGLYNEYHRRLRAEGAVDFDDLLSLPYQLMTQHSEIREYVQTKYQYVHIDEYQDTNKIQYLMASLLVEKHKNLCVVGDADQNIYSWRGADINNILRFEHDFPGAKKVVLEQNYRSTKTIVTFANQAISQNKHRLEKNTFTTNADGELVSVITCIDEKQEAAFIFDEIEKLYREGIAYKDIAILYRANFQSRIFEEQAIIRRIPYQLLGTKFFERKEVKDVMAYFKAAMNPQNFGDYKRALQTPARGIGKVGLAKLGNGGVEALSGKLKETVLQFEKLLKEIRDSIETKTVPETLLTIVEQSGLMALYKDGDDQDIERLENMQELVSTAASYTGIGREAHDMFLEHVCLGSDQDELEDEVEGIRLMTIHSSKGLEFSHVFVPGLEQELFPHTRYETSIRPEDSEEERRLFYVAITRARHKLYLTNATYRTLYGDLLFQEPSEFIQNLDTSLTTHISQEEPKGVKAIFIDF